MGFIYKITNKINGKMYIGKTLHSNPENRWKEHLNDFNRPHCEKRPLYEAMNKYSVDNFSFEVVEDTNNENEREQYYINLYRTFVGFDDCNGYNATIGGDGKRYRLVLEEEIEEVVSLYKEGKTVKELANYFEVDTSTISRVLRENNINIEQFMLERNSFYQNKKKVVQLDKNTNEIIAYFESTAEAGRAINKPRTHISAVCRGERKSAYGYKWKYID